MQAITNGSNEITSVAGNFTVGKRYTTSAAGAVAAGVYFNWLVASEGVAESVLFTIWTNAGVSVATVTATITAAGLYYAAFPSPVSLAASTSYVVSSYNATHYMSQGPNPNASIQVGQGLGEIVANNLQSAGNVFPTGATGLSLGWYELVPVTSPT
jgi:hypothetical protein